MYATACSFSSPLMFFTRLKTSEMSLIASREDETDVEEIGIAGVTEVGVVRMTLLWERDDGTKFPDR